MVLVLEYIAVICQHVRHSCFRRQHPPCCSAATKEMDRRQHNLLAAVVHQRFVNCTTHAKKVMQKGFGKPGRSVKPASDAAAGVDWYTLLSTGVSRAVRKGSLAPVKDQVSA